MKKHTLLVMTTALALGIALSVSASAQLRNPNDGGLLVEPSAKLDGGASKSTASSAPYYGRSANDGGPGPQPTAAQLKASSVKNKTVNQGSAAPGRNPNDGGPVQ
jgi:hypothetical protein